jgi:hypothetical protein
VSHFDESRLPSELQDTVAKLEQHRRRPGEAELDELKGRARRQAARTTSKGAPMKARLATAILTLALIGGGGGAVIAASGGSGSSKQGAADKQYCPPKSPGGEQDKKKNPPGNKCGQP